MKKSTKLLIAFCCSLLVLGGGYSYWQYADYHPSTANAYINGHKVEINAYISGQINHIFIQDNQFVPKGQLLLSIDAEPMKIAVERARADLELAKQAIQSAKDAIDVAKAQINQAIAQHNLKLKNAQRISKLVRDGRAAIAQGDNANAELAVSKALVKARQSQYQQALDKLGKTDNNNAQLRQAQAALKQAKLNLAYTKIYAPASGKVAHFSARIGDMVRQGQSIFTLIEEQIWWVDANFKETQFKHIQIGQKASITLDMYPNLILQGRVASISGGTGSTFSILPSENAAGNWVKVTQRIPVKIILEKVDKPLTIGASAYVTIDASRHE